MAIAGGALLVAACGGGGNSVAATVNGADITTEDVEGLLYEVSDFDRQPEQFATYLSVLIQWGAINQRAVDEFGIEPTEDQIGLKTRELVLSGGFDQIETFLVQRNLSRDGLRQLVTQIIIEESLHDSFVETLDEPTIDDAQRELDESPAQWTEVCVAHILVETADEAETVLGRLDAGEDFATIAAEVSIDPGSAPVGGVLQCAAASSYVPEFAQATLEADIGEVFGPVQTEFGYHVMLVGSRTTMPLEELRQALGDQAAFAALNEWLNEAVVDADVFVDEERGNWVTEPQPQVIPPPTLG
ncbi:MAG: hypothetical protein BMS9Abin07_1764 [Acidimicrobiia bacterium]|nr:MAG: hypothetical protein BMS9Abin07_1764 [Acidimicrobiia bacterium]